MCLHNMYMHVYKDKACQVIFALRKVFFNTRYYYLMYAHIFCSNTMRF